jgi:hypothetical protein
MGWIIVIVGAVLVATFWYRQRGRRRSFWYATSDNDIEVRMRCPLEECSATMTVRTDPESYPSRRYRDVTACSLRPSTSLVRPVRRAYFADVAAPISYIRDVEATPRHPSGVACAKPCLRVLNAAESGAAEPVRCTSGVSDGLELVRQTASPGLTRVLWFHSV